MVTEQGKTQEILARFNDTLDQWINALDDYTIDVLQTRPSATEWSLGQVYVHLIQDTGFFVDQIKACIASNGADNDKHMPDFAQSMFANNAFPDAKLGNPNNDINLIQPESVEWTKAQMQHIRDEINTICSRHDLTAVEGKAGHPGFGYFNAIEWLQFAEMHLRHHLRQKERIDEAPTDRQKQV